MTRGGLKAFASSFANSPDVGDDPDRAIMASPSCSLHCSRGDNEADRVQSAFLAQDVPPRRGRTVHS
jgi:hypothetical protein